MGDEHLIYWTVVDEAITPLADGLVTVRREDDGWYVPVSDFGKVRIRRTGRMYAIVYRWEPTSVLCHSSYTIGVLVLLKEEARVMVNECFTLQLSFPDKGLFIDRMSD